MVNDFQSDQTNYSKNRSMVERKSTFEHNGKEAS